ncbi:hypothetical protein ACQJBY_057603 [Aegilops geniculata]
MDDVTQVCAFYRVLHVHVVLQWKLVLSHTFHPLPPPPSSSRDRVAPAGDRSCPGSSSASSPSFPPPRRRHRRSPPGLARATLVAAAPGHSPLGCSPARGGGRRGVFPRRRRSGVAAGLPGAAQEFGWTAASPLVVGWRGGVARRRPLGPDLGPSGPIWVWAGRRRGRSSAWLPGGGGAAMGVGVLALPCCSVAGGA